MVQGSGLLSRGRASGPLVRIQHAPPPSRTADPFAVQRVPPLQAQSLQRAATAIWRIGRVARQGPAKPSMQISAGSSPACASSFGAPARDAQSIDVDHGAAVALRLVTPTTPVRIRLVNPFTPPGGIGRRASSDGFARSNRAEGTTSCDASRPAPASQPLALRNKARVLRALPCPGPGPGQP